VSHYPKRGDEVEWWLKDFRNQFDKESPPWMAIDMLLDDYRLRSDVGANLRVPVEELGG